MGVLRGALVLACSVLSLLACAQVDGGAKEAEDPGPGRLAEPVSAGAATVLGPASSAASSASAASVGLAPAEGVEAAACPSGMVNVERFCIDRYEAHLVVRGPGGEIARHPHFQRPEEGVAYEARSEAGVFPQAYISRVESQVACERVEKRLCSRKEWQRACMGEAHKAYPYGPRWQPGRCNADKPHLLTLRFGADPRRWGYAQFNDPILGQEPGFLARAGEHDGCTSDAGVHDLVGNVHEWVSDTAGASLKARLDTDGVSRAFQYWSPGNGVFMGGFYSTHGELGPGCLFTTIAHEPAYHDYSTGFRCCADAADGS